MSNKLPHFDPNKHVTGPYLCNTEKRWVISVRDTVNHTSKSQLFARYIAEQHLGRELLTDETIDHFNRNRQDDSIENLRIVSISKNASEDAKRVKKAEIICILCGDKAFKSARNIRGNAAKGKAGPFCGRSCAGKYGAEVQLGLREKLPAQPPVESEYFYIEKQVGDIIPINVEFQIALEQALNNKT